jgi:hypothetical protein
MKPEKILLKPKMVLEAMKLLNRSKGVVEIRILGAKREGDWKPRQVSGYFDYDHMVDAVEEILDTVTDLKMVMMSLQVLNPALLARTGNQFGWDDEIPGTTDHDVHKIQWLPIDLDPIRPTGISSTDEEHEAAHRMVPEVREHLGSLGFPDPVVNDSGNGAHLLYAVDLPASDAPLIHECLKSLALKFNNSVVKVDTTLANLSRFLKLPGCYAMKGADMKDRPHRLSHLLEVPDPVMVADL